MWKFRKGIGKLEFRIMNVEFRITIFRKGSSPAPLSKIPIISGEQGWGEVNNKSKIQHYF